MANTRWFTRFDGDPIKRIAFGTQERAQKFADATPGWLVISDADPDWKPMVGSYDGPAQFAPPTS
ncbi:MAG: hypothetical protein WKF57_06110 [Nakamurella sp.]